MLLFSITMHLKTWSQLLVIHDLCIFQKSQPKGLLYVGSLTILRMQDNFLHVLGIDWANVVMSMHLPYSGMLW